ncbi:E3 ubiquitin-protein ligase UPL5-like [Ananas comosus]|uniref:HECT-type E3 ubiquitin transferase n=1 Tax=Ananas comosus TaxID=4615 RepID=A0A6P5EEP5_ANACO|nr:E3 ubiquitin-protein ligase UPL5-like [Ananas comosus]
MAAANARRRGGDRHHRVIPSKRKLDEDDRTHPRPSDPAAVLPPRTPSTIHFFVRAETKTLVIHANPDDTVQSVVDLICGTAGVASREQCLVYGGRQLQGDSTLAECFVGNDSSLHLTGRLRSTKQPRAWQLANDMVFAISSMIDGRLYANRDASYVNTLVKEFLILSTAASVDQGTDPFLDYVEVFLLSGATVALVKLYLTKYHSAAEKAIRYFVNSNSEYLPKDFQVKCIPILLDFCKLLAWTVGKKDSLYLSCRNAFASLLDVPDCWWAGHLEWPVNVIPQLLPFAREMADIVIAGLSSDSMLVSAKDLCELSSFLHALRRAVQEWMGGKTGPIPKMVYNSCDHWISTLYAIYRELLKKVDECLKKLNRDFLEKGMGQSKSLSSECSHILVVLTELNSFLEIYEDAKDSLHSVLLAWRLPINALVKCAKRNSNLYWLLKHKDLLEFEARRNLVLMLFPDGKDDFYELHEMLIDRSRLLEESFEYIIQADASALRGGLFMEFKNEEATGPGVLREWFSLVCHAIFSPQNVLFLPCANDQRRFFPNPASAVDPLHLNYFVFSGRVIALALMHKVQVGIAFDRLFFLQLAGKAITLEDIKDADPFLYSSSKKILEMDADLLDSDALGLTFTREIEGLGTRKVIELCPGGKDKVVNSKNREEYIDLLIQDCFVTSISKQVSRFAQGFGDVLADSKLQKFFFQSLDIEDFDRMLGGSDCVIDIKDWKAHTEYNGYKAKDRLIGWFWKVVESMSIEQQRMLLYFWTSVKYLPIDGFGGLPSKLYIQRSPVPQDRLPTSHTCFYRLLLPPYPSLTVMRARLQMIIQEHVSSTFGIW